MKCRCRNNFSAAFRHSGIYMIFQYKIARITPSAAVYGRAGCITVHYLQFGPAQGIHQHQQYGRAWCIHFHSQHYGRADVFLSTASSMDVQGVYISKASTMGVKGVSFSTAISMDVQGVYISIGHAWCIISTASTTDVQSVSLFIASSMDVQGVIPF